MEGLPGDCPCPPRVPCPLPFWRGIIEPICPASGAGWQSGSDTREGRGGGTALLSAVGKVAATLFEKGPPPSTELLSQCCSAVSQAQGRPRGWVCEACSPGAWHLRVPASPSLPAAGSAAGSGGTNCSGEESSCDRWGEGNVV